MNQQDVNDNKYDRFWKMRILFDQLNDKYAKFYSSSEHLAMDEVTALFRRRFIFKHPPNPLVQKLQIL
jgi:hypothetical protein